MRVREGKITGFIGEGLSSEEIGHRLRVGTPTVKSHVRDILEKVGFRTRLEIAAYARRNGRSRRQRAPSAWQDHDHVMWDAAPLDQCVLRQVRTRD